MRVGEPKALEKSGGKEVVTIEESHVLAEWEIWCWNEDRRRGHYIDSGVDAYNMYSSSIGMQETCHKGQSPSTIHQAGTKQMPVGLSMPTPGCVAGVCDSSVLVSIWTLKEIG